MPAGAPTTERHSPVRDKYPAFVNVIFGKADEDSAAFVAAVDKVKIPDPFRIGQGVPISSEIDSVLRSDEMSLLEGMNDESRKEFALWEK